MKMSIRVNGLRAAHMTGGFVVFWGAVLSLAASGTIATSAMAQGTGRSVLVAQADVPRSFDIPAQPLEDAVTTFGLQSGLQITLDAQLAAGLTSRPLQGTYTPGDGLQRMLEGTGLTYRFTGPGTVMVERASSATPVAPVAVGVGAAGGAAGAAVVADGPGEATQTTQKPVKVPEILVKDVRERDNDMKSYVAEDASTATRTDTPIRDVPQSIQVITRKVIEEQRAFRLDEALKNVSGVITNRPSQGLNDSFLIRGFEVNQSVYRNGLIDPSNILNGMDSYNIQRLEVLKGPASVLYGVGDPGGIINMVTKKPLADPYYSANVTLGNFNFYRTELDATGPLNASKTVLYRINFAGQDAGSFVDYVKRDMVAISPAVTWLMGSRTALTVEADYLKRWVPAYIGVPSIGTVLPNINGEIPRNRNTSLGSFEKQERTSYRVGYDVTHQFNNNWSIRNAYRFTVFEANQLVTVIPLELLPDQRTLTRFGLEQGSAGSMWHQHFNNMFTNVLGHFQVFGMDHRLLTGFELRQDKQEPLQTVGKDATNLDIFAPDYSQGLGAANSEFFQKSDTKMAGMYLQDLIALLPTLKLLAGVRFDYVHQSANFSQNFSGPDQTSDDTGVSPRLGLVYQPIEPLSLYTSWTRGFLPNPPSSFNPNGQLFKPERSTQYEIGVKSTFLDNRVSATLAWYHLTRSNLLTPDPTLGGVGFQVQTGEQRSQGIELDVTASLTSGWNVIATYAYTDAEVTQDNNPALVNQRLGMVPYNKATLWSTYFFQEGPLEGFGVGGGVFGYTNRNASIFGPELNIPGYVRVDGALYYNHALNPENWLRAKQVNVALNFRNLFNQGYIESAFNSTTQLFYGESRTVLATVGVKF
ncbi:Ferrichrome iron receptor [Nitrospira japonica]|uniref:Ferrichrome iron receptor n=1 Tax=Nitrospira japonica TaxID=1325564 RepID=A0A1W1IB18_9BACT|nr:TonB-dependent receptor [Nitrospira japonica]SLM50111.1 Ferrichrome iron receptor [Nitrospira japonica]